jgi:hypothetical protein
MKTKRFAICAVLLVVALAAPAFADMIVGPFAATDGATTTAVPSQGYSLWGAQCQYPWTNDGSVARGGDLYCTGYLNFDSSAAGLNLANSGPITSATVDLWFDGTPTGNPTVGALDAAWDQTQGLHPCTVTSSTILSTFNDPGDHNGRFTEYVMDITSLAQAWQADPSTYHGLAFWTDAGDFQGMAWAALPSWGPQDSISLTVAAATPEPATMALLALGGVSALLRRRK